MDTTAAMPAASVAAAARAKPGARRSRRTAASCARCGPVHSATSSLTDRSTLRGTIAAMPGTGRRSGFGPTLTLDPGAGVPLYEQVYRALRDLIVRGVLAPGAR